MRHGALAGEVDELAGAVLGTITDWLRRDCPGTPEEIGAAIWPYALACGEAPSDPAPGV